MGKILVTSFELELANSDFSHSELLYFPSHGFREIVAKQPVFGHFEVGQLKKKIGF